MPKHSHAHMPSPALPLRWKCKSVPFPHGTLPATHSALPVCDPLYVLKKEAFNLLHFSADAHWVSFCVEHAPSIVNTPLCLGGKRRRNVAMCLSKRLHLNLRRCVGKIRCISFKCVFLFPSVSCDGFIPAVAFYQREHQSTRLTFNPKPGQVQTHTHMYIYTHQTNAHTTSCSHI